MDKGHKIKMIKTKSPFLKQQYKK